MPETAAPGSPGAAGEGAAAVAAPVLRYRHYKGGIYEHVCVAIQESDLQPMIVYRAADGSLWTRPQKVFFELIEVDGVPTQRFTPLA